MFRWSHLIFGLILFITETYALQHFSDISRYGIYTSLAGVGLHLLGGMERRHRAGAKA